MAAITNVESLLQGQSDTQKEQANLQGRQQVLRLRNLLLEHSLNLLETATGVISRVTLPVTGVSKILLLSGVKIGTPLSLQTPKSN